MTMTRGTGGFHLALSALLVACGTGRRRESPLGPEEPTAGATEQSREPEPAPPPDPPTAQAPDAPPPVPVQAVHVFEDGHELRVIEQARAEEEGLTVIDLSNGWAPYVFGDCTPGLEDCKPNAYRPTFVALANERPVPEGASSPEGRYLELFGVPPSLSVIRRRVLEDEAKDCMGRLSFDALREFRGFLSYPTSGQATDQGWVRNQAQTTRLAAARAARKLGLSGPDGLAGVPGERSVYERFREADVRLRALVEAQERVECEGMVPRGATLRHGSFDWPTHQALATFERKNRVFGWGFIGRDTIDDLRRTPAEGHYQTFIRALEERIVDAAGIVEDGSIRQIPGAPASFRTLDGREEPLRNLVEEYRNAALEAMGLTDARAFTTWIERMTDEDLETLKVAARLPPRPSYYGGAMELSVEVDRGDVWYDFPWDAAGNQVRQPVTHRPHLTLYTTFNGQRIPLVHYGTTIGGWRSERINGQDYYSYKNSDVGPRFWRQIYAAPVWIPPDSTPLSGLLTKHRIRGRRRVNYDEFGPGYASAYGLVAAYNVQAIPRDDGGTAWFDNGIRVHGSVDYMSIMQRHSHGCHRLYNHLALRLFEFVIKHRPHTRVGQTSVTHRRQFDFEGQSYRIELDTRGYVFALDPPVPVEVLPGRIMGTVLAPPDVPVRKPGVAYDLELEPRIDPTTGLPLPSPVDPAFAPGAPPPPPSLPPTPTAPPADAPGSSPSPPAPPVTPAPRTPTPGPSAIPVTPRTTGPPPRPPSGPPPHPSTAEPRSGPSTPRGLAPLPRPASVPPPPL